jgi:hypothetical protein
MSGSDPRESSPAKLHLRCPSFQEFIEEYSPRISSEGILLPVDEELPEGAPVDFEITLSDDFRVLRGGGAVAWFAAAAEPGETGAGLAVRFTNLDNPGRRLIDRLVERHRADGGRTFSLVRWPDSIDSAAELASDAPLLPPFEGQVPEGEEAAPEIDLSSPQAGAPTHREPQPASPGRPSRTPAGEDSVLIPAPALDGEPLPAESWPPAAPDLGSSATEESAWETTPSGPETESPLEGPEASPVDTLHVPPVPQWEGRSTSAVDPAELAMETVRVESFEPLTPAVASPRAVEPETDLPHPPPVDMAGVGRAGSSRAAGRRLPLLALLALALAAVWAVRSDLAAPLWDRLGGRGEAPRAEPAASQAPSPAEGEVPTDVLSGAGTDSGEATEPSEGVAPVTSSPAPPPEGPSGPGLRASAPAGSLRAQLEMQTRAPAERGTASGAVGQRVAEPLATRPAGSLPPLSRVLAVESEQRVGETEVRLIADGVFTEGAFNGTRVQGGAPRILIRVLDVAQPYQGSTVEIGSPEVTRVRVGVHQTGSRTDLHFVADLTSDAIRLVSADAEGTILRLRFAR